MHVWCRRCSWCSVHVMGGRWCWSVTTRYDKKCESLTMIVTMKMWLGAKEFKRNYTIISSQDPSFTELHNRQIPLNYMKRHLSYFIWSWKCCLGWPIHFTLLMNIILETFQSQSKCISLKEIIKCRKHWFGQHNCQCHLLNKLVCNYFVWVSLLGTMTPVWSDLAKFCHFGKFWMSGLIF